MNRTHSLLLSAVVLGLVALVVPKSTTAPAPKPPVAVTPLAPTTTGAPRFQGVLRGIDAATSSSPLALGVTLSSDKVLAGDSTLYARVDVTAVAAEEGPRQPVNLAIAIDHSGSMQGQKMEQAKNAAATLINTLRDGDHLAIVAFSTQVESFPSTVINEDSRVRLRAFVSKLMADGSTNISGALEAATFEVRRNEGSSRVILLSDGQPTVGLVSSYQLDTLVDGMRAQGVTVSAYGVGLDYNGMLMTELANHGGGTNGFIANYDNMTLALTNELQAATRTLARQVALHYQVPTGVTVVDVPGHAFTRNGSGADVSIYDLGPGQSAEVMFKLSVSGAPSAGNVVVGGLSATCIDVKRGVATNNVMAPLVVTATSNADDVKGAEHADVVELAKKVDLNVRLAEAERAYESGDTTKAIGMLDNIRSLFGMSADALAGDDLVAVRSNWEKGGNEGSLATKSLTMKTMKNFGMNNTSQY